jgi:aerobic carbon-monoxide dehydrogenase medium subunit
VSMTLARNGTCGDVAIALLSAGPRPVRAEEAERRLKGSRVDAASLAQAAAAAVEGLHPTGDIHGSGEYRLKLLRVMTERALTKAAQRAATAAA